jgi:hypothetical protein
VPHTIFLGDQVNEDEMGRACGMYVDKRASHAVQIEALELSWLYVLPMCHCLNNLERSVN